MPDEIVYFGNPLAPMASANGTVPKRGNYRSFSAIGNNLFRTKWKFFEPKQNFRFILIIMGVVDMISFQ